MQRVNYYSYYQIKKILPEKGRALTIAPATIIVTEALIMKRN